MGSNVPPKPLKACPCCGGKAMPSEISGGGGTSLYGIHCIECGVGVWKHDFRHARAVWKARVVEARPVPVDASQEEPSPLP